MQDLLLATSSGKDALPSTALSQTSQEWFDRKGCATLKILPQAGF